MFIVYILKSLIATKSYVGMTDNLDRRLDEHNASKNFYTKRYAPWKVIHTENYETIIQARNREKYLKSASGRRLLKKKFAKLI